MDGKSSVDCKTWFLYKDMPVINMTDVLKNIQYFYS